MLIVGGIGNNMRPKLLSNISHDTWALVVSELLNEGVHAIKSHRHRFILLC